VATLPLPLGGAVANREDPWLTVPRRAYGETFALEVTIRARALAVSERFGASGKLVLDRAETFSETTSIPGSEEDLQRLRQAIDDGELVLHYQPKVDLQDGSCRRVEALVRWSNRDRGLLLPDSFLPLAESSGLMRELTVWVVREAVRQARRWNDQGLYLVIAVNLPASFFQDASAVDLLRGSLEEFQVSPYSVEIELTESGVMTHPGEVLALLNQFDRMGVKVSIDDFGTGFSSLAYLRDLPVNTLKIDKSFVTSMLTNDRNRPIVASTIALGHALGLRVVAEGVEDAGTAAALLDLGCDEGQGFFWTPALPAAQLTPWLARYGDRPVTPPTTGSATPEAHALRAVQRLLAGRGRADLTGALVDYVRAVGGSVIGADDGDEEGLMQIDLTLGLVPAVLPVAVPGSVARRLLEQTLPLLLTTADLVLDRHPQDDPGSEPRGTTDRGTGDFVVASLLSVPEAGTAALEDAFAHRLHAVEDAPGFKGLEVWSDEGSATAYVMVSWWACRADFQAYMKSEEHRRSHARVPRGENRPRADSLRRFKVIGT
jgi:EAL domain-containing protein (putative c-di-GMP-specific phosphodiesterase class I)/heme-degrading monooxygenase HmoA